MTRNAALSFVLPMALALAGCSSAKKEGAEAPAATSVETAKAKRQSIQRVLTAGAILYPVAQSSIASKISAPVRRFLVNRGDRVRKGQLLAELEDRDLVAAAAESQALYEQAQAQLITTTKGTLPEDLTKARADVESARQGLDAARRLLENRVTLVREGALAQKLADDAKVAQVQAQSQFDTAQRHLQSVQAVGTEGQMKSAQGQVDAAKARLSNTRAQVGYAEIRSPIDGFVADRPVNAGEMAAGGSALLTIVDTSEIVARANIPVSDAQHVRLGNPASIQTPDGNLEGKVTVVSPAVNPASTTVEIWIRARNPGFVLKAGATAKVNVKVETIPDAVVIPASALLSSDEGENQVMVVDAGSIAHERKVVVGVRQGDLAQITEGLQAGEDVVVVGGVGLADKVKVQSTQGKPAADDSGKGKDE